jgi:hypothetical protein
MPASSSTSPSSSPASQASKTATCAPTKARAITGTGTRGCPPRAVSRLRKFCSAYRLRVDRWAWRVRGSLRQARYRSVGRGQVRPRACRRSRERPVTAEPACVISVTNPWAWRIVTGLQVVVVRTWKPSWRGLLWIHTSKDSDLSAPAELWPPGGQLVNSAIIGHVTLADIEGRPGAWRWVLTEPRQLAEPVTGVHGHPGLWLIDLPPRLSASRNFP